MTAASYTDVILALQRIADDPTETPARRERARKALADDRAERIAWGPGGVGHQPRHHTSGDAYLGTLATEEGWNR